MAVDVVEAVERRGATSGGLVTTAQLLAEGCSRSSLARAVASGRVLRIATGVHALEPLPPWPSVLVRDGVPDPAFVTRVLGVLLQVGPRACATGPTAAALRGWGLLVEPREVVHVEVPHGSRAAAPHTATVRQRRDLRAESVRVGPGQEVLVVSAARAVHGCLALPLLQLVVLVDSALRAGDLTVEAIADSVVTLALSGDRARLLRALQLCDAESGSVLESVFRVRLQLAGVSGWQTQRVVRDRRGRYVVRTDVCFEGARLVVELDGSRWHEDRRRDRLLDNALAACGWRVLRYGWDDVVSDHARVLREVREALLPASADRDSVLAC